MNVYMEDSKKPQDSVPDSLQPPEPVKENSKQVKPFVPILILVAVLILSALGLMYNLTRPAVTTLDTVDSPDSEPTPQPLFLTLETTAEAQTVNGELLVRGRTLPNTTVIIYSNGDEASLESDAGGTFESTIVVSEDDVVTITAFAENGEEQTRTFTVSSDI